MKIFFKKAAWALVPLFALNACGKQDVKAHLTDVGTDLDSQGETYMYWIEGNNVIQGRCHRHEPVVRSNCNLDTKFMPYSEFSSKLLQSTEDLVAEARKNVSIWQSEFHAIDNALRSDPYNSSLAEEWRYVKGRLDSAREELRCAEHERQEAIAALRMVTDQGVTYRVMWNNDRYEGARSYVARFYGIFNGVPTPPPPPPSPPRVTWVDGATGKTWGLVADQMTWNDANSECQRRPGWRLPLTTKDFAGGDGSNLEIAQRLFASPVGAALPQLPYRPISGGSDYQAKVIWTGDHEPSSSYGALLNVYADISGSGLSRYMHLLSSDSKYTVVCVKD